MNQIEKFKKEVEDNIKALGKAEELKSKANDWIYESSKYKYSYNFTWLGRPIIQYPEDMIAMQEIIWEVKPDLIIETGIAHGGSLIYYASILELLGGERKVLGIDIEIREHNRNEIEKHPMFKNIQLLEGSSTDIDLLQRVKQIANNYKKIMVILDSNHTHEHVLAELSLYEKFVSLGSYLVVMDTCVEDMPDDCHDNRPWGRGNNPKTAVWEFLKQNDRFEIDKRIENKILITVAPSGYLKCVR